MKILTWRNSTYLFGLLAAYLLYRLISIVAVHGYVMAETRVDSDSGSNTGKAAFLTVLPENSYCFSLVLRPTPKLAEPPQKLHYKLTVSEALSGKEITTGESDITLTPETLHMHEIQPAEPDNRAPEPHPLSGREQEPVPFFIQSLVPLYHHTDPYKRLRIELQLDAPRGFFDSESVGLRVERFIDAGAFVWWQGG